MRCFLEQNSTSDYLQANNTQKNMPETKLIYMSLYKTSIVIYYNINLTQAGHHHLSRHHHQTLHCIENINIYHKYTYMAQVMSILLEINILKTQKQQLMKLIMHL